MATAVARGCMTFVFLAWCTAVQASVNNAQDPDIGLGNFADTEAEQYLDRLRNTRVRDLLTDFFIAVPHLDEVARPADHADGRSLLIRGGLFAEDLSGAMLNFTLALESPAAADAHLRRQLDWYPMRAFRDSDDVIIGLPMWILSHKLGLHRDKIDWSEILGDEIEYRPRKITGRPAPDTTTDELEEHRAETQRRNQAK